METMIAALMMPLLFMSPGVPPAAAGRPLDVASDTTCPSADAVSAKIRALFPQPLFGAVPERVHIVGGPQSIRIDLARADGVRIVERELRRQGDCGEMASAAAVVVVAWEAELHPELLEPPDVSSTGVGAVPPPQPPPSPPLPPLVVSPTTSAIPPAVVTAAPSSAPATGPPFEVLTMVGGVASVVGGSWAPGGRVSVVMGRQGRHLALSADAWGGDTRTTTLAPGKVRWRRFGAAIGPTLRLTNQPWELVCSGQIAAGTIDAEGVGFGLNQQATGVQPGAVAAVAVTVGSGRVFAWTSARAIVWPAPPRVRAVVVSGAVSTPIEKSLGVLEVDFSLGLGVRLP